MSNFNSFNLFFIILFVKYGVGVTDTNANPYANFQTGNIEAGLSKNEKENPVKNHPVEATNFEIKAMLTKCMKPKSSCDCHNTFQCQSNETRNLETEEYRNKCEEKADENALRKCEKKISLTLKIKNRGLTNCNPQYIVLDHVFDPETNKKQKLLNPYVLKIVQKPVFQMYELVLENVVNSGPSEKVMSKNDEGYSGCSTDPSNPTCGPIRYDNKEVPYSTGFCCPCTSPRNDDIVDNFSNISNSIPSTDVNQQQQQIGDQIIDDKAITTNLELLPNLNEPAVNCVMGLTETNLPYLPDDNKIDYGHDGFVDKGGKLKENDVPINAQNMIPDDNFGSVPRIGRQSSAEDIKSHKSKKRIHKRGGQDCDDKYTPPGADPDAYHASTHCMEFSDVWYSVYKITHPDIEHSLEIRIFEKISMGENGIYWREVTSSGSIFVGTPKQRYENDYGTILAYYAIDKQSEYDFTLDCINHRLLIPDIVGKDVKDQQQQQYPEVSGGPGEYLVVKERDLDLSGKTCNKAGVGYEAFVQQPKKCESDRNSCLQNQPRQMWQHDHDLEAKETKGCYFLKNFGVLPEDPVRMKACNGSSKKNPNKLLKMYYLPCFTSSVNINFAADMNVMLRADMLATITEVYTETLTPKKVSVIAKILNSALVTSIFYVGIGACPMEIPASFGSITSQPVLLAPQTQHIFTLEIYCELPLKSFYCSLEVFNMKQQLIALRRIRFERADRCFCVWYCECACFRADSGLKCNALEIEQYHAAGFQGGMAFTTQAVNYSEFDDAMSILLHIILFFCLTLWYMGLIKAILGLFSLPIGLWGLDKILDLPKKLNKYYERELEDQEVVYDEEGWPVHPETGKKVNNVAPPTQFAINMVFFYIFPFAILWNLCKKVVASKSSSVQTFSDLDICQCKASQISLLKDYSLQNMTHSRRQVGEKKSGHSQKGESKGQLKNEAKESSDGIGNPNKKKSQGCLALCSKGSKDS